MAIFYEKIKGCSIDTTGTNNKDLWSIVKWGGVPEKSKLTTGEIKNFNLVFIPTLTVHGATAASSTYNFGHFLVAGSTPEDDKKYTISSPAHQYIYTDLCFGKKGSTLYVEHIESLDSNKTLDINDFVCITDTTLVIKEGSKAHKANFVMLDRDKTEVYNIDISSNNTSLTSTIKNLTFNNITSCSFKQGDNGTDPYPFQFKGGVKMDGNTWVTGSLKADSKVEALYFNATSDSRAKTILGKVPNALSTIVDTPIYEYFYTDDAKKTELIGILAQDLLKNGDEFHIVNNQSATGVNGDFMTIKEDRLTFVLWKALQELTEEVKELRNEVNELRGGK